MNIIEITLEVDPHDILTVNQLSDITGRSTQQINTYTQMVNKQGETKLDVAFPFPDKNGDGIKFVVRNDKCEKFIKFSKNNPTS